MGRMLSTPPRMSSSPAGIRAQRLEGCRNQRTAFRMRGGGRLTNSAAEPAAGPRPGLTIGLGFALGVLVSVTSVGSGALGTVALMLLYPRMATSRIVGSDLANAVPLTVLAGMGHWALGTISFNLLLPLLLGSIPGIILGSVTARYLPDALLRIGLAAVLAVSGYLILIG